MPRTKRTVIPDVPHHITQRGNNRQDVFFVADDREVYLELLKKLAAREGLSILGYCLMTNHVHLVAAPPEEQSLARALGRAHFLYTQYVNRMHRRSGHLWQNRFHSCALGARHFWVAMRYVEQNPVRARLVKQAWKYPWSSAAAHCGEEERRGLLEARHWRQRMAPSDWQQELARGVEEAEISRLRGNTSTGRPLGSDSFVSKLEVMLGRRLRPLPGGRPKGKRSNKLGDCP
jgi:putative transposase